MESRGETLWAIAVILRPPLLSSLGTPVWAIPSAASSPGVLVDWANVLAIRELCLVSCGPASSQPLTRRHNRQLSYAGAGRSFPLLRGAGPSRRPTTANRETQHIQVAHMIFVHAWRWCGNTGGGMITGEYEVIRSQTQPEIKAGNAKRIVPLTRLVYITRKSKV